MKRLLSILLVALLALPAFALAQDQEPFLFRGRYTWGMSMEEIKQQAAQEGLTFENEYPTSVLYQNVPVAGIFAKELHFGGRPEVGLDQITYTFTDNPEEGIVLYPLLLEQLTLVYGEPYQINPEEYEARWQRFDAHIMLMGNLYDKGCFLSYVRMNPKPTSPPLTTNGL